MPRWTEVPALLPLLFITACGGDRQTAAPPAADSSTVAEARTTANALGADLMGMLTRELTRGGPPAAIAVCADSAQQRTLQHQKAGIQVRRVGTRVRNPANAPDSVEQAVLAAFGDAIRAGRTPADTHLVVPAAGGGYELRYLRPVRIQEPCLACHGQSSQLAPEVSEVLSTRYPGDQATGYAVGELRGAVSVRVSLPSAAR
jgi:hypothetical protein